MLTGLHTPLFAQAAKNSAENLKTEGSVIPSERRNDAGAEHAGGSQVTTPVPHGTYENYGVWQQVQLGATSLINPSVAKGAAVVYAYPLSTFVTYTAERHEQLADMEGFAVVAKKVGKDRYVTLSPEEENKFVELAKKYGPTSTELFSKSGTSINDLAVLSYKTLPSTDTKKLIKWSP